MELLIYIPNYFKLSYCADKLQAGIRIMFRQKYILRILIFLVLILAVIDISIPKIDEYNLQVREKQETLKRQANGADSQGISFGLYSVTKTGGISTILLSVLFLSLVFTKRIFLSFLSLLLFSVQVVAAILIMPKIERGLNYFSYSVSYYLELLLMAGMLALSFWLAFSICRLCHRKFRADIS